MSDDPEFDVFQSRAREQKFFIKVCNACGDAHWYPRAACPFCDSPDTAWREASGLGTIYSFTEVSHARDPYILAFVTLDEGPTMMTNIVPPDTVAIGQAVKIAFLDAEGGAAIPVFKAR